MLIILMVKKFIQMARDGSPDNTSHEGGVWKLWHDKKNVGKDVNRLTTDKNLNAIE